MSAPESPDFACFVPFDSPADLRDASLSGDVQIRSESPYRGSACLVLRRPLAEMERGTVAAQMPAFAIQDGIWELSLAMRAKLHSPDSSYAGVVRLELLNDAGEMQERFELFTLMGESGWTPFTKRLELPGGAARARVVISMEKASGEFAVDQLTARYVGPSRRTVTAITFASAAVGNLFLPAAPLRFRVSAVCRRERSADQRTVTVRVRDYWGAEYATRQVTLADASRNDTGRPVYSGDLDLSDGDWEIGKYFELHAEMVEPDLPEPARDTSSFAVLPEAITKRYAPFDVPFTASCWNPGVPGVFPLIDRLGLRVTNVYSRWSAEPPYAYSAPGIEEVIALGMGALLSTPVAFVERRRPGAEAYDETALYQGAFGLVSAFKDRLPIALRVGNEPHPADEADAQRMIAAYRAVYQGAHAAKPDIVVTGTSCGPEEVFFRNGYQDWQDVYIYHQYKDAQVVYKDFERYNELVARYGKRKPVWSTELGLNSNGMSRDAVAIQLIKIFTNFFACGGQNASWFGIMWPDPDGRLVGTNGDSFDVFNSKYCLYSPKLTGVAEYHMVNAVCVKRVVAQRHYPDGTSLTLFRDAEDHCLITAWNDRAQGAVRLPLPGVGAVRATRLDGSGSDLDAAGAGLTLALNDEPYILLFDSADLVLPETLEPAAADLAAAVTPVVKGAATELRVACHACDPAAVRVSTPPGWGVAGPRVEGGAAVFHLGAPAETDAREGRVVVGLPHGRGELYLSVEVQDALAITLLPLPYTGDVAGVVLDLVNRGAAPTTFTWSMSLPETHAMRDGSFDMKDPQPFTPAFVSPAAGEHTLAAGASDQIVVRVANLDRLSLYRARLELRLAGRMVTRERLLGGFVGVPKVSGGVTFDGRLGDPKWQQAHAVHLDQWSQVHYLTKRTAHWDGPDDLSGVMRLLWDDAFLYLGMAVKDDVYCQPEVDALLWRGDGLQFLVDPCRASEVKPGKYDYVVSLSRKGAQAWCAGTADAARAPSNEVTDFRLRITPTGDGGNMVYEVAIPWHRISPFQPTPGGNIGLAMIINNDDGHIRDSFIAWFGCAHSKQMAMNGDLILLP